MQPWDIQRQAPFHILINEEGVRQYQTSLWHSSPLKIIAVQMFIPVCGWGKWSYVVISWLLLASFCTSSDFCSWGICKMLNVCGESIKKCRLPCHEPGNAQYSKQSTAGWFLPLPGYMYWQVQESLFMDGRSPFSSQLHCSALSLNRTNGADPSKTGGRLWAADKWALKCTQDDFHCLCEILN